MVGFSQYTWVIFHMSRTILLKRRAFNKVSTEFWIIKERVAVGSLAHCDFIQSHNSTENHNKDNSDVDWYLIVVYFSFRNKQD